MYLLSVGLPDTAPDPLDGCLPLLLSYILVLEVITDSVYNNPSSLGCSFSLSWEPTLTPPPTPSLKNNFLATTALNCVSFNVSFLLTGDEQGRAELKLTEQHKLIGV